MRSPTIGLVTGVPYRYYYDTLVYAVQKKKKKKIRKKKPTCHESNRCTTMIALLCAQHISNYDPFDTNVDRCAYKIKTKFVFSFQGSYDVLSRCPEEVVGTQGKLKHRCPAFNSAERDANIAPCNVRTRRNENKRIFSFASPSPMFVTDLFFSFCSSAIAFLTYFVAISHISDQLSNYAYNISFCVRKLIGVSLLVFWAISQQ